MSEIALTLQFWTWLCQLVVVVPHHLCDVSRGCEMFRNANKTFAFKIYLHLVHVPSYKQRVRNGRARSRGAGGVSQSQPGSRCCASIWGIFSSEHESPRSASPSSIKSYHTYFNDPTVHSPASPFTATVSTFDLLSKVTGIDA